MGEGRRGEAIGIRWGIESLTIGRFWSRRVKVQPGSAEAIYNLEKTWHLGGVSARATACNTAKANPYLYRYNLNINMHMSNDIYIYKKIYIMHFFFIYISLHNLEL